MEAPLSVLLRYEFRQISGAENLFMPGTIQKGKILCNAKYVYDVQEIEGIVSARCNCHTTLKTT